MSKRKHCSRCCGPPQGEGSIAMVINLTMLLLTYMQVIVAINSLANC